MRLSQYYAVKELSRYEVPVVKIAEKTGLTTVMVDLICKDGRLPDIFLLQNDNEERATRCPHCGCKVFEPCLKCCQEAAKDKLIEVIRRPEGHQSYMLNVHIYHKGEIL